RFVLEEREDHQLGRALFEFAIEHGSYVVTPHMSCTAVGLSRVAGTGAAGGKPPWAGTTVGPRRPHQRESRIPGVHVRIARRRRPAVSAIPRNYELALQRRARPLRRSGSVTARAASSPSGASLAFADALVSRTACAHYPGVSPHERLHHVDDRSDRR